MIANTINGFHSMEITCEKRKQNTCYQNKPFVIFSTEVLCYCNPPLMLLVKLIIQRLFFYFCQEIQNSSCFSRIRTFI